MMMKHQQRGLKLLPALLALQLLLGWRSTHPHWSSSTGVSTTTTTTPFTVFWNLYLPADNTKRDEILTAMREQVHQVARGAAHNETVVLKYVTIGNLAMIKEEAGARLLFMKQSTPNDNLVDRACASYAPRLVCHHIHHVAQGFEQVTLDPLYEHCQGTSSHDEQASSSYVAYIHNKGSHHADSWTDPSSKREMRKDVWRRHGAAAAVHPDCRRASNNNKCNVCGLLWTPVPWNHAPGNFWTARCDYIRKLVKPSHYEQKHNQLFHSTYNPMREAGKMVATKTFLMGQSRWAMEMWVGSHPNLQPCDLSMEPDVKDWMHTNRINVTAPVGTDDGSEDVFAWAPFPRHTMRTFFEHSEPRYNPGLLDRPEVRFRDYNLLGGMITRWRFTYGEMPPTDSWMWSFYPDGNEWLVGLKQYGMDKVYEVLSKPHWDPPSQPQQETSQQQQPQHYNATKCRQMSKNGHCQDAEGGAWNYRNADGTCAHTEQTAPKDGGAVRNLPTIFPDVRRVLDFGGGPGIYLTGFRNHFRNQGVVTEQQHKLVSMEPYPLEECLFQGLEQDTTDLLHTPLTEIPSQEYDLVMTFEVLEHVPVDFHRHLIQALTKMTKKWLIVCAAHPGQPGEGHIGPSMKTRQQWMDEILENVGDLVEYDADMTAELHRIPTWPLIKVNGSVFRRKDTPPP